MTRFLCVIYYYTDEITGAGEFGQTASHSGTSKIYEGRAKRQTNRTTEVYQAKGS